MKSKLILRPRGTQDILGDRSFLYYKIENLISQFLFLNNFQKIIFPSYEDEKLLTNVGNSSDIVTKEVFSFTDKKGRRLVLRPEGTASVSRLVAENKLLSDNSHLRLFYWANMFRYERSQKGRYREFWQLGVELVNFQGSETDLEAILLANSIFELLGVSSQLQFSINYLGSLSSKQDYRKKLKVFFSDKNELLCSDCRSRLQNNPLRILDCKVCHSFEQLPNYSDSLPLQEKEYFARLLSLLNRLGINYSIDQRLVRGLDYYSGFVFEVTSLLSDKSIAGGGRYDGLINSSSSDIHQVPSVGFAIGIDRLVDFFGQEITSYLLINNQKIDILFISLEDEFYVDCFQLRQEVFNLNLSLKVEVNIGFRKKSKSLHLINRLLPKLIVTIGKNEITNSFLSIKDTNTKIVSEVKRTSFSDWIKTWKLKNND